MSTRENEFQIAFSVMSSISDGPSLDEILLRTLRVLVRKLNLKGGAIFQFPKNDEILPHPEILASIPANISRNPAYPVALEQVSKLMSSRGSISNTYHSEEIAPALHIYIMELPEVGLVLLIKAGEELSQSLLWSLQQVNNKWGHSTKRFLMKSDANARIHKAIIDTSCDGFYRGNAQGFILDANQTFAKMTGYTHEELLTMHMSQLDANEKPEDVKARMELLITQGNLIFETQHRHKDGHLIDVEISSTFMKDSFEFVSFCRDITKRKQMQAEIRHQAEELLRSSEERYKTIFMQAPFGIAVIDSLSGHVCEVNQQFADIAGRSIQEMSTIDWMQITHPDDVQADLAKMALLNAGEINGFRMEKRYLHPDGVAVWIDMTVLKLNFDNTAHPLHFCIIQDITERKQNEAAQTILNQRLHDHQFYTRSLIESNFDAIMITDQSGNITDVNKQMETLTGSTRDELIGSPSKNYFTDPDRAKAFIKQVLTEKKVTNYELTCLDRDGKETSVSYSAAPLYDRYRKLQGVIAAARLNNLL